VFVEDALARLPGVIMRSTGPSSMQGNHGQNCIHLIFNVAAILERQRIEASGVFDKRIHELRKLRPDTGPSNEISLGSGASSLSIHVSTVSFHMARTRRWH
jgi:hypothetical protein